MRRAQTMALLLLVLIALPIRGQTIKPEEPNNEQKLVNKLAEVGVLREWPQEPDGFKGVRFGATKNEAGAIVSFPRSVCNPYDNKACRLDIDGGGFTITALFIFLPSSHKMLKAFRKPEASDGAFRSVIATFPSERYGDVKEMLIVKYGQPHNTQQSKVQSRMGATFDQEELDWVGKRAHVTLSRYGSTVAEGIFAVSATDIADPDERKMEDAKKTALQ